MSDPITPSPPTKARSTPKADFKMWCPLMIWVLAIQTILCTAEQDVISACPSPDVSALSRVWFDGSRAASGADPAGWSAGSEAHYSCDPGFLLLGQRVRTCLPDASWSGAAPHCFLNAAERSSLTVEHAAVADGYLTTHQSLQRLFSWPLLVDLFGEFQLLQLRLITSHNLTGYQVGIRETSSSFVNTFTLESRALRGQAPSRWLHTVTLQSTSLPSLWKGLTLRLLDAGGQELQHRDVDTWKMYELQLLVNSTGLSWRQCLDDVGRTDILETWAADGQCYHLVAAAVTQPEARRICLTLGSEGTLFAPLSGDPYSMLLSRLIRYAPPETFWISDSHQGSDRDATSPQPDQKCLALQKMEFTVQTVLRACHAAQRFICQRAPRVCGSPPQESSLSYSQLVPAGSAPPEVQLSGSQLSGSQLSGSQLSGSQLSGSQLSGSQLSGSQLSVSAPCRAAVATEGRLQCQAPHWRWTRRPGCAPAVTSGNGERDESDETTRKIDPVGAIAGGAAGALVLLVAAAALVCSSRRRRRAAKQPIKNTDYLEFMGLNPNPMYAPAEQQNACSQPEAIYEEPSFTGSCMLTIRDEPPPPPVPRTRPSISASEKELPAVVTDASDDVYDEAKEIRHTSDNVQDRTEYSVPLDRSDGATSYNLYKRHTDGSREEETEKLSGGEYATPYKD